MADKKITQLTNITGANLVDADEFVVVDISADETKAITLGELKEAFDSGSGFVRITGDTMTGDLALSGADVTFGDNDKAIFGGVTSELQIYSDGSNSIIREGGTGTLRFQANGPYAEIMNGGATETMARFNNNGSVDLYYDNAPKLATTSTGIDVTGEITADGLTVENGTSGITVDTSLSLSPEIKPSQALSDLIVSSTGNGGHLKFKTNSTDRVKIDGGTGDISFYDSQGSSQSFFWDASAESLGIGTTSPATALQIVGLNQTNGTLDLTPNAAKGSFASYVHYGTNGDWYIRSASASGNIILQDTGGNVGIGTSSPGEELHIETTGGATAGIQLSTTGGAVDRDWKFLATAAAGTFYIQDATASANRLAIDSSGNVGIGTSDPSDITGGSNLLLVKRTDTANNYPTVYSASAGNAGWRMKNNDGDWVIMANDALRFYDIENNSEAMRIDSSGRVGIGTSSPATSISGSAQGLAIQHSNVAYMSLDNTGSSGRRYTMYSNTGGSLVTYDEDAASARMVIDSLGRVGIGTSSPDNKLQISDSTVGTDSTADDSNFIKLTNKDVASVNEIWGLGFSSESGGTDYLGGFVQALGNYTSNFNTSLIFGTRGTSGNATERMRIDSSGNLQIGTTTSAGKLTVDGSVVSQSEAQGSGNLQLQGYGATSYINHSGTGSLIFRMGTGYSEKMRIDSSGNVKLTGLSNGTLNFAGGNTSGGSKIQAWNDAGNANGYLAIEGYSSEYMRIDSSGNVGIGVVPETGWRTAGGEKVLQLDTASIYNNSGNDLYINSNWYLNSSAQSIYIESDFATSYSQQSGKHIWYNAASGTAGGVVSFDPAMTLDSSNNLLVGVTSTVGTGGFAISPNASNGAVTLTLNRAYTTASSTIAVFLNGGLNRGSITYSEAGTSYNTSSDYRLKEDIQPIAGASDRLLELKPCNFAWRTSGTRVDGFLAHEAQEVVPESVTGAKDAVDADGNPEYQGIDQSKLVPLLTAALQETLTKIETLEARITALEG